MSRDGFEIHLDGNSGGSGGCAGWGEMYINGERIELAGPVEFSLPEPKPPRTYELGPQHINCRCTVRVSLEFFEFLRRVEARCEAAERRRERELRQSLHEYLEGMFPPTPRAEKARPRGGPWCSKTRN